MKLVLIVAMTEEIEPIRQKISLRLLDTFHQVKVEEGKYHGQTLYLVESGIGKANAAMGATLALERFHPELVMNYGVAGGLDPAIKVGDVIIPNDFCYHDADDTAFGSKPGRVPRMPDTYPLDRHLLPLLNELQSRNDKIRTGQCLTSDTFMTDPERIQWVRSTFPNGVICEMEATAIAQVAYCYDTPFLSVKAVSDHSSENAADDYMKAKDTTAENGTSAFFQTLDLVIDSV